MYDYWESLFGGKGNLGAVADSVQSMIIVGLITALIGTLIGAGFGFGWACLGLIVGGIVGGSAGLDMHSDRSVLRKLTGG